MDLAEQLPAIIAEAARSPLGLFALMIVSLAILGFYFFRQASERTRIAIFVMLFVGVAVFGVSIVQTGAKPTGGLLDAAIDDAGAVSNGESIEGVWQATVTYDWGATYQESLEFDTRQGLTGTASFLGLDRGILNAAFEGDQIYFEIPFEEVLGDLTRDVRNIYRGTVFSDRIEFVMQDDRGTAPIRFEATRPAGQ